MKGITSAILTALLFCSAASIAGSSDKLSMRQIMSIAKVNGACGMFFQMTQFQESTQLEGGQAFIARFLMAEAARLGKSPEAYIRGCNEATDSYQKLWALFPD